MQSLYEEDRIKTLRLTKLTHTAGFPKTLQRHSVPLVCQVFKGQNCRSHDNLAKETVDQRWNDRIHSNGDKLVPHDERQRQIFRDSLERHITIPMDSRLWKRHNSSGVLRCHNNVWVEKWQMLNA